MKREEAIAILQDKHDECKAFYDLAAHPEDAYPGTKEYMEALQMALAALRIPTREQVEAWKGEWIPYLDGEHIMPERYYSCSKCGNRGYPSKKNFCVFCGAPMTDEAVEITLRRLEALHENDH